MDKSIWSDEIEMEKREPLKENTKVDVLVIGAGMTGILTAYLLFLEGKNVAVVEAKRIGQGVTGNTTAKITSAHRLIYDKLIKYFGEEKARQYGACNESAIQAYKTIVNNEKVLCNLEEQPAFIYTLTDTELVEREAEAAKKLGISASFTKVTSLPFSVKGAVRFENQLQFNPMSFMKEISKKLTIYENTKAIKISKDNRVLVRIKKGPSLEPQPSEPVLEVKAEQVVVATHYPFLNIPGYYFLKMYQERSYVVGVETEHTLKYGMYIDEDIKGLSFRKYKNMILIGGGGHQTGKNKEGGGYEQLYHVVKEYYSDSYVTYQWSAQDCITLDGVPYIGNYSKKTPNLYVATGFQKWGMTTAMVAATLIRDKICGRIEDTGIFSNRGIHPAACIKNLGNHVKTVTSRLTLQLIALPETFTEDIPKGEGKIVRYEGKKMGVYKTEEGEIFGVDTKCPHLGCMLSWNKEDHTWDCPCHGSRFSYKGELLENPSLLDNRAVCIRKNTESKD